MAVMFEKYQYVFLAIIVVLMFGLAMWSMSQESLVIDEFAHIPAGFSYLKFHDYRLNPEHPPLMKLLAGFPLLFYHTKYDEKLFEQREEWEFGRRFFLLQNKDMMESMIFASRMPMILLGLLLCISVFFFAKKLYGAKAGLLASFLTALSPNILAHTRYVTTDLGITLFYFLSVYFLWRFLQKQTWKNLILLGVVLGCAFASKFTALFIIPVFGILLLIWFFIRDAKPYLSFEKIKNTLSTKPFWQTSVLLAGGFLIALIHSGFLILASRWLRAPMFLVAAASQANLGGVASAPIVAELYQRGFASVGLLMAILGNVIGTYLGILSGQIARWISGL